MAIPKMIVTQEDLQDKNLDRLNRILATMQQQIAALTGNTGPVALQNTFTAQNITLNQPDIPTDPNTVITKGTADKLYSVDAIRQALVSSQTPVSVTPVQPIKTS